MADKPVNPDSPSKDDKSSEEESQLRLNDSQKSLFADPLPKWLVWPLDSKLPMVPGPQNVQFYTTHVGEKIVQSYPELDFNLWDPNANETPTEYAALHDPHLHKLLESRHFREHLVKEGLVTKDGKVLCDLKEFNRYRAYLDTLYHQLERKELEDPSASKPEGFKCGYCEKPSLKRFSERRQDFHKIRTKLKKRRQIEKMAQDLAISVPNAEPTIGHGVTAAPGRTDKVQQIQERLKNKQKLDKARLQKRLTEDNEKRSKLVKEREKLVAERERLQQEQFQSKLNDIKDRQFTDRQMKLDKIKQHLDMCDVRAQLLVSQRQNKLKEKQIRLKKLWDLKKSYQMKQIATNQAKDAEAEAERKKRIEQRHKSVRQQQQQHEDVVKKSAEKARQRRSEREEMIKQRLTERRDSVSAAGKMKYEKGDGPITSSQSNFVLTESLIAFMQMLDEAEEASKAVQPYRDGELDYSRRIRGVDPTTVRIYSQLPVSDLLPQSWVPRGTPRDGWWNNDGMGVSKHKMVTCTFDQELATKTPETIEEAAAKCVQMVTFLAAKVVHPALVRAEYEEARQAEIERRRLQREDYLRKEEERKRREEERKIRAEETKKRKAEISQKKREEEEAKKAAAMKARHAVKKGDQKPKAKVDKRDTQIATDEQKMSRKTSSVRFDLASTTDIPTSSKVMLDGSVSPVVTDSLESELAFIHESESDDLDETEDGGIKVEANDSLILIRNSRTKLVQDIQPSRFASLLAVEILDTLQNALTQSEADVKSESNAQIDQRSSTTATKTKDLHNLHITPLAKILVDQAIRSVAKKLGIDIPAQKKVSDGGHHYVPRKKSSSNVQALKDIDYKTPATVLTLTVLEAAARQTGTPFDRALFAKKLETPVKKLSKIKKSSFEHAASAYGTSAKLSGHDRARTGSKGQTPSPKGSNHQAKSGSGSTLRSSKETKVGVKKSSNDETKRISKESGAVSETFHVGSSTPMSISTEVTTSSPQLTGAPSTTHGEEQKQTGNATEVDNEAQGLETAERKDSQESSGISQKPKDNETEMPKRKGSFFARVSSFLLPKRMSSKNVTSKISDQEPQAKESDKRPSSTLLEQVPSKTTESKTDKATEDKPETPLGKSKSSDSQSEVITVQTDVSSSQLTEPSAKELGDRRSSRILNNLVRAQLSRILYNAKIEFAKEQGIEIKLGDRKVISDTQHLQEIVSKQVSKVLLEEKPIQQSMSAEEYAYKLSDSRIIERLVHDELCRILQEGKLELGGQKSKKSKELLLRESSHAFPAIANAYSSEMNINGEDLTKHSKTRLDAKISGTESAVKPTQHPIHIAMLKKIASKIEKEEGVKNKKGLESSRNVASSMLQLDSMQDRTSKDYLETVTEWYKYSLRDDPTKCTAESAIEDVLKNNLITAINLIREGIMPNPDLTDLISAVVASYLIAHSILPLSEDTSNVHSSFGKYKGLEIGKDLSTPVLIDTLTAEILDDVKQHLRVGTFNAVHVIMAVNGMHKNSIEIAARKEVEILAKRSSAADVESSDEEEIIAISEPMDTEFVPMFGDQPLQLGKEEASSALIAFSVKEPDQIDTGTDAVERNSFYSLIKPDVSRLKTFSDADRDVNEEAARKHLSAVSMQFKKRSETKFGPSVQAAMKGAINYEKLKRGSLPIMSSMRTPEKVDEESDESDEDEKSEKRKSQLRSQSLTLGINVDNVPKVTDPKQIASGTKSKDEVQEVVNEAVVKETRSDVHGRTAESDESVKSTKSRKSKGSVVSERSGRVGSGSSSRLLQVSGSKHSSKSQVRSTPEKSRTTESLRQSESVSTKKSSSRKTVASEQSVTRSDKKSDTFIETTSSHTSSSKVPMEGSQSLDLDGDAEVPPEDPALVRLSARRVQRAQERAAEKRSSEVKTKSSISSSITDSQTSTVASPRQSHTSVGTGLTPRPSDAFKSDRTASYQDQEQQKQIGVQTSDSDRPPDVKEHDKAVQVTGNEAAVQTSSSIKQYGRLGISQAVGTDSLGLFTPLTLSENEDFEYKRHALSPDAGETISVGAIEAVKGAKTTGETRQASPDPGKRGQRPSSGPTERASPYPEQKRKGSNDTFVEEIVEYEEITEISPKPRGRRMSFVPNFQAAVPVIGAYGQQSRRMSYFPGFEQTEDRTRSVLDETSTPEMPNSSSNRDNFVMDEDDDVQSVSPLVSVASTNLSHDNPSLGDRPGPSPQSPTSTKDSARSSQRHTTQSRSSNRTNNNVSLPKLFGKNSNNNSSTPENYKGKKIQQPLTEIVSKCKNGETSLKRFLLGSNTKSDRKDSNA